MSILSKSIYSDKNYIFSCIQGTIRPNPNLNAELAARQLNAAFQGIKSDAVTIINILTTHSNHQRQKIKRHYKILYVKVSTHIRVIKFIAFLYLQITYILQIWNTKEMSTKLNKIPRPCEIQSILKPHSLQMLIEMLRTSYVSTSTFLVF